VCSEIFHSAHQLFSHELREHEHVGILQIDHTKKQSLPKYNQCEEVSSSENGVHETKMHDRRKEASNLKSSKEQEEIPQVEASVTRGTLQNQYESHKTHTSNLGGKLQLQDGKLQAESSDFRGKSQKQGRNRQTHTSIIGRSSQMQDGNQQPDTCKIGGKSQKQGGNQRPDTCSMGRKSEKQHGDQQTDTCNMGRKSEQQDGNQQTDTCNIGGKSQKQDGNQRTDTCHIGKKSDKQDGHQQTDTCDMGKKSEKQDGNQQTDTCNVGRKSEKQDGDQQTDTCNMGRKSQKQDGDQHRYICNMGRKSEKQDGDQQTDSCNMGQNSQIQDRNPQRETSGIRKSSDNVCQHRIKMRGCESEVDGQNINSGLERDTVEVCSSEFEASTHQIRKHDGGLSDQNTYLVCKESFISVSKQFVCEVQDHNKEAELLQQGSSHCESTVMGKGEENVSEVVNVPEVTLPPSKGIRSPYKCHVCEESFGTKCDLFYHDLQVHVGIAKPKTIKSWKTSFKDAQNNLKEKTTLNKGEVKRKARNIPEEQQPVKVIITEAQNTDEQEKQKIQNRVAEQVTLNQICEADAGNKPIQKLILKKRIIQGDGTIIKVGSGKHEHVKKTIQAITGKYPWNETLVERGRGRGNELAEQGGQTQPKTFVIVKDGPQSGEGDQKKSGKYRIDVVTNYIVPKSQVKQFLLNCDGSDKE
jgi:hypothetical protein